MFKLSALLLAASGVVAAGCSSGQANTPATVGETAAVPVESVEVRRTTFAAHYRLAGSITAESEAPVRARSSGEVQEILVEEGDVVRRGQVLARLDGERTRLELRRSAAELERLQREHTRQSDLHRRGLVSSASFDALSYDVEAGKAAYERARLEHEYTAIRSTLDGVVSTRSVKRGQQLSEGAIAFTVTNTRDLLAYLNIPQSELSRVSAGQPVSIVIDAQPGATFNGNVERISPTVNPGTGTFRATLRIENEAGLLAPGMFGRFSIATRERERALVVPASAVLNEDGTAVVYVIEGDTAVQRNVTVGIEADGLVEIVDGLADGERVVLGGLSRLKNGSRVVAYRQPASAGYPG